MGDYVPHRPRTYRVICQECGDTKDFTSFSEIDDSEWELLSPNSLRVDGNLNVRSLRGECKHAPNCQKPTLKVS